MIFGYGDVHEQAGEPLLASCEGGGNPNLANRGRRVMGGLINRLTEFKHSFEFLWAI